MEMKGKAFLGGLGQPTAAAPLGSWTCVRDWDLEDMRQCGIQVNQLACFSYDEATRAFSFLGPNDQARLVPEEAYRKGLTKELSLSALLP